MGLKGEFDLQMPTPRRGLTSVEAQALLGVEFPECETWTCWHPLNWRFRYAAGKLIPMTTVNRGEVAGWKWHRLECNYPSMTYTTDSGNRNEPYTTWTGAVRLTSPRGMDVVLFSYLGSSGEVGVIYMASTANIALLQQLEEDLVQRFLRTDDILIRNLGAGSDIHVPRTHELPPILEDGLLDDIGQQARAFFEGRTAYARLRIPYRRGFLFVGPPGNGKTLATRYVARSCSEAVKGITFWTFRARKHSDDDDIAHLFDMASCKAPSLIVLEDIDSLANETQITRAGLLSELDGLSANEGVLVLASTNHPEDIDSALCHRPSRFDRVWHFKLPDSDLRRMYVNRSFPWVSPEQENVLVGGTEGWSFAYLNELRASASAFAVSEQGADPTWVHVEEAHRRLSAQFSAGRKGHLADSLAGVGFGVQQGCS